MRFYGDEAHCFDSKHPSKGSLNATPFHRRALLLRRPVLLAEESWMSRQARLGRRPTTAAREMEKRIKEKFPYAFDDICLYSEVSHLLAHCMFRLASRRFIQELFQDVHFMPMYEEADAILTKAPKAVEEDADPEAPTDNS